MKFALLWLNDLSMDLLEQHAQALAKSVTSLLEGVAAGAPAPATAPNLEDALLEGADAPAPRGAIAWAEARAGEQPSSPAEALLRADLEAVLRQRSQLRAKLVAETERREAAEAELVALGAQWLGTETQAALRRRAEQQDERRDCCR